MQSCYSNFNKEGICLIYLKVKDIVMIIRALLLPSLLMNMAVPVNFFHLERARLDFGLFVCLAEVWPWQVPKAAEPTSTEGLHMATAAVEDTATDNVTM